MSEIKGLYLIRRCQQCGRDLLVKVSYGEEVGHFVSEFSPECEHWGIPKREAA